MKFKRCAKCNEIKLISEFDKRKTTKDNLHFLCKDCDLEEIRKYRSEYPETVKEHSKKYREENPEKIKKFNKKWNEENREKIVKYQGKKYKNNLAFRLSDYMDIIMFHTLRRSEQRQRREDPKYRLDSYIGCAISASLKNKNRSRRWETQVGYSLEKLKKHLQALFDKNMCWSNYGKYWHLDHVIPKSKFNYTKPEHIGFRECWRLSNLQPLETHKNKRKSNKLFQAKQENLII